MFTFSMRRLSQLGTVVGGSVASSTVLAEIHNEAAAPPRAPVRSIRPAMNFEADADGPMSEYVLVKDEKSPGISNETEEAALDVIVASPEILLDCLPAEYVARQPTEAYRLVQNVSKNPGLIEKVKIQMQKKKAEKEQLEYTELKFSVEDAASQMWDQLRIEFPCVLCQDVLAAPTLLSCSHDLCGSCAEDLLTRCMPCDPNNDGNVVLVACPTCRAEINQTPVLQLLLHEKIEERVLSVPDCPSKRDYQERRNKYLTLKRTREAQAEKKHEECHSSGAYSNASYLTNLFGEFNIGLDTPPPLQTEFYEQEEYWVAAIAFMVFLLAGIVKYSK